MTPGMPRTSLALCATLTLALLGTAPAAAGPDAKNPWMAPTIVKQQARAKTDAAKEAVARNRARALIGAMTLEQKMQQLTGSMPELLHELPDCYGARHVSAIPALQIPTFRISNGPVGVGQNDCVSRSVYDRVASGKGRFTDAYTHPTSAQATALPSGMGVAASFDPSTAALFGEVIATEMNNLGLHVFEAPGANMARLPILGRNFEYFGEDPFLTGTMAVAETRAVQSHGLIAMAKHFVANEQETNRQTIQETIDPQALRELYLLPFEMAVKDGRVASIMCAYNYVNTVSSCENESNLTGALRKDWGFTGYVQTDFFAMKSTVAPLAAGMDHEMPIPSHWAPAKLKAALDKGEIQVSQIDTALERRYTQMFKAGIFDRPLVQTPIDFPRNGAKAREIGVRSAVLLQNNGALPFAPAASNNVVVIGKATQVYAQQAVAGGALTGQPMGSGGGSSDVVPHYTVTPVEGIRSALAAAGNRDAKVKLILVDDANATATIDGAQASFNDALVQAGAADAVVLMAGTISEEGADRATFTSASGNTLAAGAVEGSTLDWYSAKSNIIATTSGSNAAKNSNTVAMIEAVMSARSTTARPMAEKTALVLKDNAGVAMDPKLVGAQGPAILEVWFPGQEDGNIVADLLFGRRNPAGKLPVTFPFAGKGFLDSITPEQFPGVKGADGKSQTVSYTEGLHIGYRWYDANVSGQCAPANGVNPCVAFPFGHGLSYTRFSVSKPSVTYDRKSGAYLASATVTNTGKRAGAETVQAYLALPAAAGLKQPPKRLVGFRKVELAPGASKQVTIAIDPAGSNHPLSVWDEKGHAWVTPAGEYDLWVGTSSSPAGLAKAGSFTRP